MIKTIQFSSLPRTLIQVYDELISKSKSKRYFDTFLKKEFANRTKHKRRSFLARLWRERFPSIRNRKSDIVANDGRMYRTHW